MSVIKVFAAFGYIIVPAHEENLSQLSYVQRWGYNDLEKQLEDREHMSTDSSLQSCLPKPRLKGLGVILCALRKIKTLSKWGPPAVQTSRYCWACFQDSQL